MADLCAVGRYGSRINIRIALINGYSVIAVQSQIVEVVQYCYRRICADRKRPDVPHAISPNMKAVGSMRIFKTAPHIAHGKMQRLSI